MDINLIIKGFFLAWFLANFQPLQDWITKTIKPKLEKWPYIEMSLSCHKCLSFWITLVMTQDIFAASTAAFAAYAVDKLLNSFKTYL